MDQLYERELIELLKKNSREAHRPLLTLLVDPDKFRKEYEFMNLLLPQIEAKKHNRHNSTYSQRVLRGTDNISHLLPYEPHSFRTFQLITDFAKMHQDVIDNIKAYDEAMKMEPGVRALEEGAAAFGRGGQTFDKRAAALKAIDQFIEQARVQKLRDENVNNPFHEQYKIDHHLGKTKRMRRKHRKQRTQKRARRS